MAYQNVGTPRFYINVYEWVKSNGIDVGYSATDNILNTLPVSSTYFETTGNLTNLQNYVPPAVTDEFPCFWAVLGHNLGTSISAEGEGAYTNVINGNPATGMGGKKGFSIKRTETLATKLYTGYTGSNTVGSIIIGMVYDMPHSPDLNLTMTREMDGVKRIRTKGGVDLVNHKYIKPPLWGLAAPWELYTETPTGQTLSRSGRRVWDLSFSYLSDSDVFPMLSSLSPYESTSATGEVYSSDPETSWHNSDTLLDSDNFYSQVIHKTNGGQLPFIFQPDKDNNNPDGFAICKFDMNLFKFDQVANGVYNVKLKIREVW